MKQLKERLKGKKKFSILEIGCGTGRLTRQLITEFPEAKITAIDISAEMVEQAKILCPQVNYIVADAEKHLHQIEEKFDLIISNATIQWFENPEATLKKICELLAPQGRIAMATFANRTFYELSDSFQKAYDSNNLAAQKHVVPMRSVSQWLDTFPQAEISDEIIQKYFP